ncbi:MAG: hypothetical protein FJ109_10745 [Deltaproteobacteria bacterium]|nr:hypothetical protein [Deltaproteobacteria bacterium]
MARTVSAFVGRHGWWLALTAVGFVALGAVVEVAQARSVGIADWYMHLGMWVLLLVYYLLTTWAVVTGRRVRSWFNLVIVEALSIFWVAMLLHRIPPQKVVVEGQLVWREAMTLGWVSVALLAAAGALALLLAVAGTARGKKAGETREQR